MGVLDVIVVSGRAIELDAGTDDLFACLGEERAFLALEEPARGSRTHFWEDVRRRGREERHEVVARRRCWVLAGRHVRVVGEIDV